MKKLYGCFCAFALLVFMASQVQADCGECAKDGAECSAATCATTCPADCASDCPCPVGKAMAALPKMTYEVGEKEMCCAEQAASVAEKEGDHIHYVVAKKAYDDQGEAMVALAEVTEKFVSDYVTPHKCDVSGTTSVCGTSTSCGESAAKMVEVAKKAMDEVALSYKVGDEVCACPTTAAKLAADTGAKKEFVVGEATTCCEIDARIKLAHAKYRAAVMALAKAADQSTETEDAQS